MSLSNRVTAHCFDKVYTHLRALFDLGDRHLERINKLEATVARMELERSLIDGAKARSNTMAQPKGQKIGSYAGFDFYAMPVDAPKIVLEPKVQPRKCHCPMCQYRRVLRNVR